MSEQKPISPWNYKPWWCQPWSILLTGVTLISGSWLLFKIIWLTVLVCVPILTWMGFFLLMWPQLMIRSGALESLPSSEEL
jgi:ABC-type transport system involved in cytochrome c biogenesis permease subunit